jgi:hypothetical protein
MNVCVKGEMETFPPTVPVPRIETQVCTFYFLTETVK